MRVTIIRDDGVVGVDGVFRAVDLSALASGIRAVQWDGTMGHVEYDNSTNGMLDNINAFQPFIDLWTAAAPPPPPDPTAQERIAAAHDRINAAYQQSVNALTAGYPEAEIASWPKQESEARAYLANADAITPWLSGAATARRVNKGVLSALIIANADALAPLHGMLTGRRQVLRDRIDALGDNPEQAELDAIQW